MGYRSARLVTPDGGEHFSVNVVETGDGLYTHHGTLTADKALEMTQQAGVTVGFFCGALELLARKHGERYTGMKSDKLRDFLARAEMVYVSMPPLSTKTAESSSPAKPTGVSCAEQVAAGLPAPPMDPPLYHERTRTDDMSEKRTKTAKKAARATKSAKKKPSPKKKAAKKAPKRSK